MQSQDLLSFIGAADTPDFDKSPVQLLANLLRDAGLARGPLRNLLKPIRNRCEKKFENPRLISLFKIAAHLGQSPLAVLLRPSECASPHLFISETSVPGPESKKPFVRDNYVACEKVVRRLMAHRDRFILPSMISLNVRFGVSKSNFFIRHRDLCAEYGAVRRAQAQTRSSLRFVTGLTAARQVVDLANLSGQTIRRVDTISWLRKSLMLSKGVARSALRTALLEAYYLTKRKKLNQGVDE